VASYGITMPVIPGTSACLRCVYPDPPTGAQPTCETAGVLNVIVSGVASIQVADALRILSGAGLRARITTLDLWNGGIRQIDAPARDPDCPTCARGEFPYLEEARRPPESLCGRNAVQISGGTSLIDLAALQVRLEPLGAVRANEYALRFSTGAYELTVFPDGRTIVKGTSDTGIARGLYARYVG
jgi:adenylyltransferase/sulfurtransferase